MTFKRKSLGSYGEQKALNFLKKKGYKLLGQNIRLFCGEIDLLMTDKKTLVVVEVKTKSNLDFGLPQEMVNFRKQKKLLQLAKVLMQKYPDKNIRIDVVSIDESSGIIDHIINAVEES